MHPEVLDFVRTALAANAWAFRIPRALVHEVGSCNVNGSVRDLFTWVDNYIGVDLGPGEGVDISIPYHKALSVGLPIPADIIVSTEALEHDPYWEDTLSAIAQNLSSPGLIILTWAVPPRVPHFEGNSPTHYRNVELLEVVERLSPHVNELFAGVDRTTATGLFWGKKEEA
jgi:hypothetical protein